MPLGRHKRNERRAAILAVARRLLSERGFDGVTMRDLAQESGVTVQTLYNGFDGKESIIAEAIEERVDFELGFGGEGARALGRLLLVLETPLRIIESSPRYSREVLAF